MLKSCEYNFKVSKIEITSESLYCLKLSALSNIYKWDYFLTIYNFFESNEISVLDINLEYLRSILNPLYGPIIVLTLNPVGYLV